MDSRGLVMVAAVICVLLPATAYAQATGTILGNVTDSSGAAVPGATVTATNVDTQLTRDTPAVQNSNDLTGERARTSADRTHTFTFSGIWQISYFSDSRPFARALLNNWTASAIVTLQSGAPVTITAGQDRNFDGNTNDRADLVGDPSSIADVRAKS